MNEYSRGVMVRLIDSIDDFQNGAIELDDLQARLQSSITLLETDARAARDAIRLAEADVEEIRHTMLLDEQRAAVIFRLDDLRTTLAEEDARP
jgi:hypothetical protein